MNAKLRTLCLIFCLVFGSLLAASPAKAEYMDWPPTGFWNDPADPSIFDVVGIGLNGYAPPEWICEWDFGDGPSTYTQCWDVQYHSYNADGDYPVAVLVTNESGDQQWLGRTISVRTHDVGITKLFVPTSAKVGQTRQITVNVRNNRYLETVQVELYKLTQSGDAWVGTLIQDVPVRSANRTTAFNFSYTFTDEDARTGKATFKAYAFILSNGGDDWMADNEVISLPTHVSK